jgi:hypothetical protein
MGVSFELPAPGRQGRTCIRHILPTRGNFTPGEWPCRVNISERLIPKAFTRINTCPACGVGIGMRSTFRTPGPP